jgi:endo-1,4-beta-mannosidase
MLHSNLLATTHEEPRRRRELRFGVNYTPRKHWWYSWLDWDQSSVLRDLQAVAQLGVDHIRIPCLWSLFQPGIGTVSDSALRNLARLLDAADSAGLDVEVTVLNGWMSGLSFLPPWTAPLLQPGDTHAGNIFTDPQVIAAEELLFRRLVEAVGSHRRFLGFDIGNELGVLQRPFLNPVSPSDADTWAREMLAYCDEIAPGKFHVNGTDHSHWFNDFGFTRAEMATTGHASVVHSYIYFTGVLQRYRYDDQASFHLADFMVELAYAYQTNLDRPVWVEEIGVGNKEMPESYKPTFMEHAIRNIAATGKAWGITWWCSHDIDPKIAGFSDYEYGLGLIDLHNQQKPLGKKYSELIAALRKSPVEVAPRSTAIAIPDRGLTTAQWPPDWAFATRYMNLIEEGILPAMILETRAHDEAYLKQRGIQEVIPFAR